MLPTPLPPRVSTVVAGGGPAGFMAAIVAAEAGLRDVWLLEATPEPLHKVRISGGGRCNVTHACWEARALTGHYPRGGPALLGPFSRFGPREARRWFLQHGLELVREADGRLFPRSQSSLSVVACLRQAAEAAGVRVLQRLALLRAEARPEGGFSLTLRDGQRLCADRLVLATGSHPSGHRLAQSLGHSLVPPLPSLFTLALDAPALTALAGVVVEAVGLSLHPPAPGEGAAVSPVATDPLAADPVAARSRRGGRAAGGPLAQRGTVLLTHWGLSGPATLRLTAFAARQLKAWGYRGELRVDWTGGLSRQEVDALLAEARAGQARRRIHGACPLPALSRRLWAALVTAAGVPADRRWADLDKQAQRALGEALVASRYRVVGRGPFGEEFVTAGGVPLREVEGTTMESRLRPGLHLVGELLDVDGVTGGFNFQHCWTSGWQAGRALAASTAAEVAAQDVPQPAVALDQASADLLKHREHG
ncbi:MAG: NAD(P)/FAD-dependent oxidoreductase [Cyanobacteria bacterium K_Offshore_surface_m2_239]|nr:NAD(P)/FAD-dependent oxidoreductase [Cyanobacteria bacterium K_Offshore_surface_m2_239]